MRVQFLLCLTGSLIWSHLKGNKTIAQVTIVIHGIPVTPSSHLGKSQHFLIRSEVGLNALKRLRLRNNRKIRTLTKVNICKASIYCFVVVRFGTPLRPNRRDLCGSIKDWEESLGSSGSILCLMLRNLHFYFYFGLWSSISKNVSSLRPQPIFERRHEVVR